MNDNDTLLDSVPDYIRINGMLKATPIEEGGERYMYFEASNEDLDHQNEVILQTALAESAPYYLRHGNVDLSHYSILGPKSGVSNFMEYEIGKPLDVHVDGRRTFVKAQLYKGDSPMARNANMVWDSLTKQEPPSRWYPSVGGAVLGKSVKFDPATKSKVAVIDRVRWNNVALDRCPVNMTVPEVSVVPVGVFAKSMGGFIVTKAIEAGYGTDSATLTGGGALRQQSLEGSPLNYWDFREQVSGEMKSGVIQNPTAERLVQYATSQYGLQHDEATQWVERFMRDLSKSMKKRRPA